MENKKIVPIIVPNKEGLRSVNFYLVLNGNSVHLIDAGMNDEDCWNALLGALKSHRLEISDITAIILTHHHSDHVGLVNRITSLKQIPVYASPLSIPRLKRDSKFLEMRIDFFTKLYREMGCGTMGEKHISYLERSFKKNRHRALEAEIHEITGRQLFQYEVIEVPGHSPDQLAFMDGRNLFAGDLLIEHISSNALVEPDDQGNRIPSLQQHIDSMKKCLSLNIDTIHAGHGVAIENPNELISLRLRRIEEKTGRMLQLIESGINTGKDLAVTMYPDKYEKEFSLVMSEIIGHLDYLEANNKIGKDFINGVWHYSVSKHYANI